MEVKLMQKQKRSNDSSKKIGGFARFTRKEKEVLYSLFREHEQIIDIKYRKNTGGKRNMTVRECWQKIVNLYNSHPNITTQRNIKQIHKFWLNSRLRKQFPPKNNQQQQQQQDQKFDDITNIKPEPDLMIPVESIEAIEHVFNSTAYEKQPIQETNTNLEHQESMVDSGNEIQDLSNCIEQISTEKLSLNDLLHFKTTPPPITTSSDSIMLQTTTTPAFSETIDFSNCKMEQCTQTSPTNENYSISIDYHRPSVTQTSQRSKNSTNHQKTMCTKETLEDRLNYFKLKEAESKYQEGQIHLEKLKIDLEKSKEELKYMKEVNRLQIEELKTKLRILQENEKRNRLNKCSGNS